MKYTDRVKIFFLSVLGFSLGIGMAYLWTPRNLRDSLFPKLKNPPPGTMAMIESVDIPDGSFIADILVPFSPASAYYRAKIYFASSTIRAMTYTERGNIFYYTDVRNIQPEDLVQGDRGVFQLSSVSPTEMQANTMLIFPSLK